MVLPSPLARDGFTLAECLLAIVLLTAGLLGVSGTALSVERLRTAADARAAAATLAAARLDSIRGTACALRASGSASAFGIREEWSLIAGPGLTMARDSLDLPTDGGSPAPAIVLEAALPC